MGLGGSEVPPKVTMATIIVRHTMVTSLGIAKEIVVASTIAFTCGKVPMPKKALGIVHTYSEIKQMDVKINTDFGTCKNGCEFLYFHWLRINGEEEFPILKKDLPKINIGWLEQNIIEEGKELRERNSMYSEKMGITNINDYIFFLEKQKITHLLIDYENKSHDITNDLRIEFRNIFDDEKKFSYLDKEYDSVENGYNYHLKLFKIDYDKFKRQIELIP